MSKGQIIKHQTKSKRLNKEMPYLKRHQINHNSTISSYIYDKQDPYWHSQRT